MAPDETTSPEPKTLHTVAWFAALAVLAFAVRDRNARLLRDRITELAREPRDRLATPTAPGLAPAPTREPEDVDAILNAPPPRTSAAPTRDPIENPGALDAFYEKLAAVEARRPSTLARVAVIGDSVVADDKIPSRLRARLQARFGDGGPGFVYVSPPSRWYHHRGVQVEARGFNTHTIVHEERPDARLGYGGAIFETRVGAATATFTLHARPNARRPTRWSLVYLRQPDGGEFETQLDGGSPEIVRTPNDVIEAATHTRDAPDGASSLTVRVHARETPAPVRLFGAVIERDDTGVVVDNLGLVGSSAAALRRIDAAHWQGELARRNVDLAVVLLGANEAARGTVNPTQTQRHFEAVLASLRASGTTRCLVLAPLDTASVEGDRVVSRPAVPALVEAAHQAALSQHCAFWNTYAWMGGRGSALRWQRAFLMEPDLVHPTAAGAVRVADALFDALLAARPSPRVSP